MKFFNTIYRNALIFAVTTCWFSSFACNKKFNDPALFIPADTIANLSIADLKAMHVTGNFEKISDDKIIEGIVVADDESGNFYKEIVIEDSTAGITVKLDGYNLYANYPAGRKVFIKLKGLYIGDYNKLIEIGAGVDSSGIKPTLIALPSPLIGQYILKGSLKNTVAPKLITIDQLNDSYQSELIQINNLEFNDSDLSKTYADTTLSKSAVSFILKTCTGKSIALRNSSYANFAGFKVAKGNGSLLAVYGVFGYTKQLFIRDTSDVRFNSYRCSGGNLDTMNIADVRNLYSGGNTIIPSDKAIKGIVISDAVAGNISTQNIVIQQTDSAAGIVIRFTSAHNFILGDEVQVNISNQSLESYYGTLEINNVPVNNATKIGTGIIHPHIATAKQITDSATKWESTLVQLTNVNITAGTNGKWNGTTIVTDVTKNVESFTTTTASFANTNHPTTTVNTFTGIVSHYNNYVQVNMRNINDVNGGTYTTSNDPDLMITEYIEGSSNNKYLELYNASSTTIDLSRYVVKLYVNGSTTADKSSQLDTLTKTNSLASKGIIVLQNSKANLVLPTGVHAFSTSVCGFNGDDAITIEKNGKVIDVFGNVGEDPGTGWTIAGINNASKDKTIRRKTTVIKGNTDWATSAAAEWDVDNTTDDVSGLGSR
jgi:hypothetical protein